MLNALHIQVLYNRIMDDPSFTMPPRLFLFGAKAAPGYMRAKLIIRYINALAKLIDASPRARKMIKIVYIENYDVSTAEVLIPATEISEQLSTAGKEAIKELWLAEHSTSFKYLRYYEALSVVRGAKIRVDHATCFGIEDYAKRQILDRL